MSSEHTTCSPAHVLIGKLKLSDRDRCTGRERAGPPRPFPSLAPGGRPFAPRIALPWLCRCFIFRLGSPPPSSFFGRRFSSDVVALNPPPSRRTRRGPPPPPPPPFADAFGIPNIGLVRQGVVLARVHNQMACGEKSLHGRHCGHSSLLRFNRVEPLLRAAACALAGSVQLAVA